MTEDSTRRPATPDDAVAQAVRRAVERFNRRCRVGALLLIFLLTAIGLSIRFDRYDFAQYDQAAFVAREGAWDVLYPIPHANSPHNAGGMEDSDYRPGYLPIKAKYGAYDGPRFIHPPPMALFLLPLAFFTPSHGHVLWIILLGLCAWGVAVQAGRFYELAAGRASRAAGWITLASACSPALLFSIRISNVLAPTSLCLAIVVRELLRRDGPRGAAALFGSILAKYAGFVLLPLHVLLGRWRTLLWCGAISVIVFLTTIAVMGLGPFHVYLTQIAPDLGRPVSQIGNHSLEGMLLRITHRESLAKTTLLGFHLAEVAVLLLVLWAIVRRRAALAEPRSLFPAAAALICWMLIFAPVSWYQVYLIPFWGWMIWEMRRGCAIDRLLGAVAIGLGCLSTSIRPVFHLPEPFATYSLWSLVGGLALSLRCLFHTDFRNPSGPASADQ